VSDPTGQVKMEEVRRRLEQWSKKAPESVKKALMFAADMVIATSKRDFFAKGGGEGGALLHSRSGRLQRSLHRTVEVTPGAVKAEVGTNLIYARIHELGGEIRPVRAKYLHFVIGGSRVSAARTEGGTHIFTKLVRMPPRPYLSTALAKDRPKLPRVILQHLMKDIEKEMRGGAIA